MGGVNPSKVIADAADQIVARLRTAREIPLAVLLHSGDAKHSIGAAKDAARLSMAALTLLIKRGAVRIWIEDRWSSDASVCGDAVGPALIDGVDRVWLVPVVTLAEHI